MNNEQIITIKYQRAIQQLANLTDVVFQREAELAIAQARLEELEKERVENESTFVDEKEPNGQTRVL